MSAGEAFVTLAATDSYCMGAIVVAKSLRRHGTTRKIIVMVTPNVSEQSRLSLENVFDEVIKVDILDSEDNLQLSLLGRPELGITFTKIYCWTLIQYRKCVFLDADTLVLCNVDELFERDELSAAPDASWPDCFNSGVFVFVPSLHTNISLLHHSEHHGSFDGGDQGLLNSFFGSWSEDIRKHLPFVYNLSVCSIYTFLPAFQQFGHKAKIVHFLGPVKPWNSRNQRDDSLSPIMEQFVSLWWKEYLRETTSSLPGKNFTHVLEKQQPVQGTEAKMPFRETLDSSNSLIAPFSSPPEQFSPNIQPNMVSTEALVSPDGPPQNIGDTKLEEETSTSVGTDIQEPEGLEGRDGALNTGQHSRPADTEADLSDHRRLFEAGHIDYLGRDAFQNIQKMLDCFLYSEDLDHMCNTNLASLS